MHAFVTCNPFLQSQSPSNRSIHSFRRPLQPNIFRPTRTRLRNIPVCTSSDPSSETSAPRTPPFEIRGFSLANVFLLFGGIITVSSFSSYFGSNATASATSLGFVYGVPILLIGCALKYAELEPITVTSSPEAKQARERLGTETQKKVYSDITRHRYGDESHLQPALASLGLIPRGEACPELVEGEESVGERGEYKLKLVFRSVATPWSEWKGKEEKYEKFFGPGVKANVEKLDSEKRLVALTLSTVVEEGAAAGQT